MATIAITDIVSDSIDGTGIFDTLMTAVELRLSEQYDAGKIKGNDYASVYLGAMQSVLQQSISFSLGKQAADKQADLIAEQITKATAEQALLTQKKETEYAQTHDTLLDDVTAVTGLVGKQKDLYAKQSAGFDRDAEIKAAKVFTDIWTVAKSTDPDSVALALPLNTDQASMDVILKTIALNGLGISEGDLGTQSSESTAYDIDTATDPGGTDIAITTALAHGLATGAAIAISDVTGMVELNGNNYIITVTGTKAFTLNDTDALVATAHTAGTGTITVL